MTEEWTNRVVGERMAVDQEFNDRVTGSEFSNQEWSLIMSATQYTIDDPESPGSASIVVDRDETNLEAIMPELENIQEQMGALGGAGGGKSDVGGRGDAGGGFFDAVMRALGMGDDGSSDDDHAARAETARELAGEYGRELQSHLESKGRWEEVCAIAAAEDGGGAETEGADRSSANDEPSA
ncbi:DUF5799 family protein [Halorubellus sp. PRR65]|uniref:DUF5799 family protein n=1 Tax=Halorubellus sp. PRR65 TaxID=3098148 RepID=UPI002B263A1B|nr:DUF5799 family protein [Halorubellus sp. PRR65]